VIRSELFSHANQQEMPEKGCLGGGSGAHIKLLSI
jgi:hypothetical protein